MKTKQWLLFILSLGFFLRVIPLNQSYWLDEAINVQAARDYSVKALITEYALGDFHPPLYHVLLKQWMLFFGNHEVATRMLSVIFGIITVYYTFLLSKRLLKKQFITTNWIRIPLSIFPALCLSLSGLHIYYSGEARMYALAAMFMTMATYYGLLVLPKKITINTFFHSSRLMSRDSVLLVISLVGLLLSDYVPWLVLPLFFVFIPWQTLIAFLITMPWWPFFYKQLQIGLGVANDFPGWNQVVGGFSLKNVALIPIKFFIGRISFDNNGVYFLVMFPLMLVLGFVTVNIIKRAKHHTLEQWFVIFWLCVPIGLGILVSMKISLLSYFRFIFVLPAFFIVILLSLKSLSEKLRVLIVSFLVLALTGATSIYILEPRFHREDWRGLSTWIDSHHKGKAITLIPNLAQADPYKYYQQTVSISDNPSDLVSQPDTVFLLRYVQEIFDPQDQLRLAIEDMDYLLVEQKNFNGVVVWRYESKPNIFALSSATEKLNLQR